MPTTEECDLTLPESPVSPPSHASPSSEPTPAHLHTPTPLQQDPCLPDPLHPLDAQHRSSCTPCTGTFPCRDAPPSTLMPPVYSRPVQILHPSRSFSGLSKYSPTPLHWHSGCSQHFTRPGNSSTDAEGVRERTGVGRPRARTEGAGNGVLLEGLPGADLCSHAAGMRHFTEMPPTR